MCLYECVGEDAGGATSGILCNGTKGEFVVVVVVVDEMCSSAVVFW